MRAAHNIPDTPFLLSKSRNKAKDLFTDRNVQGCSKFFERETAALTRLDLPHPDRQFLPRCSGCGRRGVGGGLGSFRQR